MEIGIDIEEIDRIKKAYESRGHKFLEKIYTKMEIDYCFKRKDPYPSLCGRFCAKEAVIKAYSQPVSLKDIEIINDKNGKPFVYIKGRVSSISLSISHSKKYASAVALNP